MSDIDNGAQKRKVQSTLAAGDNFEGEIYLINADTGNAKLLTQGHRPRGATVYPHLSFSPDGSSVLFCSGKNGNWDLFLVKPEQ